jgi:hypothetical protein
MERPGAATSKGTSTGEARIDFLAVAATGFGRASAGDGFKSFARSVELVDFHVELVRIFERTN